ncbi:MAG: GNAT family N-acetyltransferase [Rikenellaceae bacterium]|nr:GNAT family N-acetyltransferase [Rikenellaceae bacterium]
MERIQIKNTEDQYFQSAWEIYNYSFPENEKRDLEHQRIAFSSKEYRMYGYLDGEKFVGFIGCWNFDEYLYIEHFAINREIRGGGYGSMILAELEASIDKTIILEIDEVVDEISAKRLRFYKNLGFNETGIIHDGHSYHAGDILPRLEILSYPTAINRTLYEKFNEDLRNTVMKR